MSLQIFAPVLILGTLLSACNGSTNMNQSSTPQYQSFKFAKVGNILNNSYNINNLFICGNSVYLSLSDQDESTFGYAKINKNSDSSGTYQTKYLMLPPNQGYTLIGEMVVDQQNALLYVPVAHPENNTNDYTWLQYESNATVPTAGSIGHYQVAADLASQFALNSASFDNGMIYGNYAGNLIGFSLSNGSNAYLGTNLLYSWQDSFSVNGESNLIAINNEDNAIIQINMLTKKQTQLGESFGPLADQGFEANPHFTIYKDLIYILTIHRVGNSQDPHLALCSINKTNSTPTTSWNCQVSASVLPMGTQLLNLDADLNTGNLYFILYNLAFGSQLYVVN